MAKKLGAVFLVICIITVPCLANVQDIEQVVAQAKKDATADVKGCLWLGGGFFFSILGVGASYFIVPSPRAERLLAKSPEYIEAYTTAYKGKLQSNQLGYAAVGCAGSAIIFLMIVGTMASSTKIVF